MNFQKPLIATDNGAKAFRAQEMALPITGVAAPTEDALFFGQRYIDTVAKKEYVAVVMGTGAADWKESTPDAFIPLTGAVAPTANADFVGQDYIDTTAAKVYKAVAVGTGAADWVELAQVV